MEQTATEHTSEIPIPKQKKIIGPYFVTDDPGPMYDKKDVAQWDKQRLKELSDSHLSL